MGVFVCQTFKFDVEKLDWNTYFVRFILGIKQFLLKEDLANLPVAQNRIRRFVSSLKYFHFVWLVKALLLSGLHVRYFGGQLIDKRKIRTIRRV